MKGRRVRVCPATFPHGVPHLTPLAGFYAHQAYRIARGRPRSGLDGLFSFLRSNPRAPTATTLSGGAVAR